jgi:hypothetical protein
MAQQVGAKLYICKVGLREVYDKILNTLIVGRILSIH